MRYPRPDLPVTVAIVAAICGLVGYPLTDYDYFWHLKTGQVILESGVIPTTEPFSFSAEGRPWLVQGGLFDAALAYVFVHVGDFGVRAIFTVLVIATWSAVYKTVQLHIQQAPRALAITLISAIGASGFFVARPFIVTLLGFAVTLYLLSKHRATGQKRWLFWIPPLMAVWVNAHFGFVLALGLMVLFFSADLLSRMMPLEDRVPVRGPIGAGALAALLLASLAALGLNPAGYEAVIGTADMTVTNAASAVVEWQSPNFHLRASQAFMAVLAVTVTAALLTRKRLDWLEVLLLLSMTGATLYSLRHMPVASIALAPVAASAFSGWTPLPWRNRWIAVLPQRWVTAGSRDLGDGAHRLNLVLIGTVALVAALAWPAIERWHDERLRRAVPVDAAAFIESSQLGGRVFNDYAAGGYLIWRLYPTTRVIVDGRYNPYSPDIIDEYMATSALRQGWLDTLERHRIDMVLVDAPDSGFAQALTVSGRYRLVHADRHFGLLIPNDGSRPDLPTVLAPESTPRLK